VPRPPIADPGERQRRFEVVYAAHRGPVLGYVLRRTGNPDDAADVIAETFLTAWRRLDEIPRDPQTRLWLYGVARRVLAADLGLLADLDTQIESAGCELAALVPLSPYATLTSVPGWGVVRVSNYAAALGDPDRWPGPRQIYRASGLSPMQYESAGKRRDGKISREGSVALRRALIDLGIGLWLTELAAKAYAAELKSRGKHGGIIGCALAHRATRIAYALVRDHASYDPSRWS